MRYLSINKLGPNSQLVILEQEKPVCRAGEVLVQVKATAVNRADLMQRQGKYPPPAGESLTPGLEIAGNIVDCGKEVNKFKMGDSVYGLVAGGGYAEYCCLHQDLAAIIPPGWDYEYATALPEALMTAQATLFSLGKLAQKQTLLIHAAGSGISSLAIQMAKYSGAEVITTTSTKDKQIKGMALGATRVINYQQEDFASVIYEQSIDLIVDFIGGSYFPKHMTLLKKQGKLVQIASMSGHHVDCDLIKLMQKRIEIIGFVLRSQSLPEKALLWHEAQKKWAEPLFNQAIKPIIDSLFGFTEVEKAHQRMQNGEHFGKIVIRL